jgi:large subunit ribosomal protein L17
MRHLKSGRKLGRNSEHRDAMMSNMVASLVSEERIQTTDTRAKELRRIAEHLVTLAKRAEAAKHDPKLSPTTKTAKNVFYRRLAYRTLRNQELVNKLFDVITPRFLKLEDGKPWNGGYTRIIKVGNRHGDNAPVSFIEYIGAPLKRKIIKRQEEIPETPEETPENPS